MVDLSYIMAVLEVTLTAIDLFAGLLYGISILFVPRFRHPNNMFILNICCTIVVTCGFFVVYFSMAYFDPQRLFASQTCRIYIFAYNISGIGISFAFVPFTLHRYCSIIYHTKAFFKTKLWIGICIAGQWIVVCLLSLPFIFKQAPPCRNTFELQVYKCVLAVLLPTLIMTVLNALIFAYIRSSTGRVQPQASSTLASGVRNIQQPIITRREISVLRQMIFTFIVFIIGWAPAFIAILINLFTYVDPLIFPIGAILCQLCILSILINLFIHNHELKNYLKTKLGF